MLNIESPTPQKPFALLNLGFRPFFLLAASFGAISMLLWFIIYSTGHTALLNPAFPSLWWHGHEMVFGYAMAVSAGFLLTAVRNWTGHATPQGIPLAILALLWLCARLLPFSMMEHALHWMALADLLFMLGLVVAIVIPIVRAKQWQQMPIVLKIALMGASNALFYAALLGYSPAQTLSWGLYAGLYLILSLIMMMGRRVIPFFIERGVADAPVTLKNYKWLDISSLFLFLGFMLVEVFTPYSLLSQLLAACLFILHSIRLWGWYHFGIWSKPLLWILYLGYGFIVLGFALHALGSLLSISPWVALHAFAAGGIGLITSGMMSRIALGHTGRNVQQPPSAIRFIFIALIAGAIFRVILPLVLPASLYGISIATAQLCWVLGFSLFVVIYAPILFQPRIDQRFG